MGFIVEDWHLIKYLQVSKGYGATSLCKMFLDNVQTVEYWCNETFKWKKWHDWQCQAVRLIVGKWSSSSRTGKPANINKVEDLALS